MKKYQTSIKAALIVIIILLLLSTTASFAAPPENRGSFFPERVKNGVIYTQIFNEYYILEGDHPATEYVRRKLDACKIMYFPDYSGMSLVIFKTKEGGKEISQTLRRIILTDSKEVPSGSYGIYC